MKQIVVKESYPNKRFIGESVTIRTLKAPTYQELFKTIDKENHELMIYQVKSHISSYVKGKNLVISSIFLMAQLAFLSLMFNSIDEQEINGDFIKFILDKLARIVTTAGVVAAVVCIIKGIIAIIKNKEIADEGNKFVKTNYPDEYDRVRPIKEKKKVLKTKRNKVGEQLW